MKSMVRWLLSNGFGGAFCSLATVGLASGLFAAPALAHHPLGGRLPANAFEGLMSGLAHPILGPDHFIFVLAIGLLALRVSVGLWLPVVFVLGGLVGSGLHLSAGSLPLLEVGITGSLVLVGVFLARSQAPQGWAMVLLGAIAGLFHGYAFGEAIFGAEMTPLWSYLLGLTLVQLGVATAVYLGAKALLPRLPQPQVFLSSTGFVFLGAGLAFLSAVVAG